MITINTFAPAEYTVWGISGVIFATAIADALFVLCWSGTGAPTNRPTRPPSSAANSSGSSHMRLPRFLMLMCMAFWGASLILRLNVLWGPNSVVAGSSVTNWTSQGWLCRIFITLALGVTAPWACWLSVCMLASMLHTLQDTRVAPGREKHLCCLGPSRAHILGKSVFLSFMITLPIAAMQSVIAWISLTLTDNGQSIEESPTSSLGTFLAPFWYGDTMQCAYQPSLSDEISTTNTYACTMCVFPAAAVIVHGAWTVLFVLLLGYTTMKLCSMPVLSPRVSRLLKVFTALLSFSCLAGLVCMGVSIYYQNPFAWSNQGLWLGYVTTVLCSGAAISYIMDDLPKRISQDIHTQSLPVALASPLDPPVFTVDPQTDMAQYATTVAPVFNPLDQVLAPPPNPESSSSRDRNDSIQPKSTVY